MRSFLTNWANMSFLKSLLHGVRLVRLCRDHAYFNAGLWLHWSVKWYHIIPADFFYSVFANKSYKIMKFKIRNKTCKLTYFIWHWKRKSLDGNRLITVEQLQRYIQNVPWGKVSILGGHSTGHSKQKSVHTHVSSSERFPR
jgi:hypothetical protein